MSQYIFNINEDEGDFAVGKCELNLPSVLHFINCEKMVNKNREKKPREDCSRQPQMQMQIQIFEKRSCDVC